VPKNFAQDIVVAAEILTNDEAPMHKYAVQITVADVRDGALSSSTLKEASSWGKVDTVYEQMVFSEATLAVAEKPQFSLEAAATTINLVKGGAAEFTVGIKRAEGFSAPIRFSFENLPAGVTAENLTAAGLDNNVKIRLKASTEAVAGRYSRIAILGKAEPGGQIQEAPKIGVTID